MTNLKIIKTYVACDQLHRRVSSDCATREEAERWIEASGRKDLHVVKKQTPLKQS
jgi:hypothetical protein